MAITVIGSILDYKSVQSHIDIKAVVLYVGLFIKNFVSLENIFCVFWFLVRDP